MTPILHNSFSNIYNCSYALEFSCFALEENSVINQESPPSLCFKTLDLPANYCGVRTPTLSVLDLSEDG